MPSAGALSDSQYRSDSVRRRQGQALRAPAAPTALTPAETSRSILRLFLNVAPKRYEEGDANRGLIQDPQGGPGGRTPRRRRRGGRLTTLFGVTDIKQ